MSNSNSSQHKADNQSKDVLYGKETLNAIDNFTISELRLPGPFLKALANIKSACALANLDNGYLAEQQALAIHNAAQSIVSGRHHEQFTVDVFQTGSGTSTNMNMNEVVAGIVKATEGIKVHPNDDVNKGQSSNDVIPSAIHLSCAEQVSTQLLPAIQTLITSLSKKANQYQGVIKTGRTHLMDAMPLSIEQEFSGWQAQLELNRQRIKDSFKRLGFIALGGTAVGTGINTTPEVSARACELLSQHYGLKISPSNNYFEAISCQDTVVELSGQLKTLAVSLLKICHDLRWMNSGPLSGLAEAQLQKLQAGSSIMPSKVNPVIPEAVTMACAQVMGNDVAIGIAGQGGNFQLNTMLPIIAYNSLQSIEILSNSMTSLADKAIDDMQINQQSIADKLKFNPILATALNPIIGYEKAAEIAQSALQQNKTVLEVALELTDMDEAKLTEILDPNKLI